MIAPPAQGQRSRRFDCFPQAKPLVVGNCERRFCILINSWAYEPMDNRIERVIKCIRGAADVICERQMYCYPGFDPELHDPIDFFAAQGIDFDGELFVRFPTSRLFAPIPKTDLLAEAKTLGLTLPSDYIAI